MGHVLAVTLYDPSQFSTSFPSRVFLLPTSVRRRTRSPGSKSLGLTFMLYRVDVAYLMTTSVTTAKFPDSSMKSSSSRVASKLALWSSGCAILQRSSFIATRIMTFVPKVRRNGFPPLVVCGVVRYAHSMTLLAGFTCPFTCGCSTEVKCCSMFNSFVCKLYPVIGYHLLWDAESG